METSFLNFKGENCIEEINIEKKTEWRKWIIVRLCHPRIGG